MSYQLVLPPDWLSLRFTARVVACWILAFSVVASSRLVRNCQAQALPRNQSVTEQESNRPIHQPANAPGQFELHPGIEVSLFAAEPMLANPSNIDIDHRGRVWVCEVINYRHFRNQDAQPREAGDRILILEDTDGDAVADKSTVFYQGRDIDSAHGVCVLGDRAIISANDSVFYLIDDDGDLKADRKEILFTGISGTQHDHGIHAFVFGPDGKLYFNFGNSGKQICDASGNVIVDQAGNPVRDHRDPYNQGMIFRCNLDGSEFETLAWNFRNNWEVCVDSFGAMWQSDNDDDGNRATRINFVMPFGDYGYTEQGTGKNWKTARTGMHPEIPVRHWHQNDPGVIPNLLITGAGSPTGICVYEGQLLPEVFHGQVIHCDAGPSVVRAYPVTRSGAGYSATMVNLMDAAETNQWFRPSDVCVAPDGSLIVADWYDPGVGGHRMQDTNRGRLFHVTRLGEGGKYRTPEIDITTAETAVEALHSPNQATRFMAWQALQSMGHEAVAPLASMFQHENPRMRARAIWMLVNLGIEKQEYLPLLRRALRDANPEVRAAAIRTVVHLRDELLPGDIAGSINVQDPDSGVRRELILGLRQLPMDMQHKMLVLSLLADQHQPGDRWYLEAIGIAADGLWDEFLATWLMQDREQKLATAAGREIVWRSRGKITPDLIAQVIQADEVTQDHLPRYFRALDLLELPEKATTLTRMAFEDLKLPEDKAAYVTMESARRLDASTLNERQREQIVQLIENSRGSPVFVGLVEQFSSDRHYPELLTLACDEGDRQQAADAMGVLMDKKQQPLVTKSFINSEPEQRELLADALVNCGKRPAALLLARVARNRKLDSEFRIYAVRRLGEIQSGANDLIRWMEENQAIDPILLPAMSAALHQAPWGQVKRRAQVLFPLPPSKDNRPLPSIDDFAKRKGNVENGKRVYEGNGTCAKCHIVHQKGVEVGPDLSEIGSKLTREAMYESLLFPSAGISHNYENWTVVTVDGNMFTGILLGESESEIQIRDDKGITHTIPTEDLDGKKRNQLSLMPEGLHKEMSEQDLVDLVEYLMTLRK